MTTFFIVFWIIGIILYTSLIFDELKMLDWKTSWWKAVISLLMSWVSIFIFAFFADKELKEKKAKENNDIVDTPPEEITDNSDTTISWVMTKNELPPVHGIYFIITNDGAEGIAGYTKETGFDVYWSTHAQADQEPKVLKWLKY